MGLSSLPQWFQAEKYKAEKHPEGWEVIISSIAITLWNIWKERNKATFEGVSPSPYGVIIQSLNLCQELKVSLLPSADVRLNHVTCPAPAAFSVAWRPPPVGIIKVNTDASFTKADGRGAGGIIFRDHLGSVVSCFAFKFFAPTSLVAEALVLREAVNLACNLGIHKILFESDCLELVNACRSVHSRGEIAGIISDILSLKLPFSSCGFLWTARSGNSIAHSIAELCGKNLLPTNWTSNIPINIRRLISLEVPYDVP